MMSKILLTGGAGYIGSHTYVALIEAGYDVVIYDNFSNARIEVVNRLSEVTAKEVTVVEGDILDKCKLDSLFKEHNFSAVIHFAALKAVGDSIDRPLDYFETNCSGLINLFQAMKQHNVFNLVFSSSATVYGEPKNLPIRESEPRGFTNPYGFTKLMSEHMMTQIAQSDDRWKFGILRYFNPAGAHESALIGEDPSGTPNNLVPFISKVATGDLPQLNIFGSDYPTKDGTGVRDYIHVQDLAEGHVASLDCLLKKKRSHTVNLGTGRGYSVLEVLHAYEKACGFKINRKLHGRRSGDIPTSYAASDKAKEILGFSAKRDLDNMCKSSWEWAKRAKFMARNKKP